MPKMIPSLNSCNNMTSGERRLGERLEKKLDEDYLIWYDVPIGKKQLRPDFIVLNPAQGILVLEVKDWKMSTIQSVTRTNWTILDGNGNTKQVDNPLEQARKYLLTIVKLLERDADLVHPITNFHRGKCLVPYGYGVVFTNINRAIFDRHDLGEVIQSNLVICKDEMLESIDVGEFQENLINMFPYQFDLTLSTQQINRIRWHIFPDIAIQQSLLPEPEEEEEITPIEIAPDLIKIMDLQQEQLARSLGTGHRVIHGVAGSGKTLILLHRSQYLAKHSDKPILVLCFNIALATKLRQVLRDKGISDRKVSVRHFHKWCVEQLRQNSISLPDRSQYIGAAFISRIVELVYLGLEDGSIKKGIYGAVLLDEGHDFKANWFKIIAQMVDPETNSLLVLYDDAQSIYRRNNNHFSFASVGIQARGRTTILKLNYRNTEEILSLAYEFAKKFMQETNETEEDVPVLVKPKSVGRHGSIPSFTQLSTFSEESRYIAERIYYYLERGLKFNDIAIIYKTEFMARAIAKVLGDRDIPFEWLNADRNSRYFNPNTQSLKLLTMHSSKGLEFPVVFISGIGYMPYSNQTISDDARLLYVAMTRATEYLELTCHKDTPFVSRLIAVRDRLAVN